MHGFVKKVRKWEKEERKINEYSSQKKINEYNYRQGKGSSILEQDKITSIKLIFKLQYKLTLPWE